MAHFAEIDEGNVVQRVFVVSDDQEHRGSAFLAEDLGLGGRWVQTSYNAVGGKRRNPETGEITNEPGFRKNYAGIGFTYDEQRDAFIPPKPNDIEGGIWELNEETCLWKFKSDIINPGE